MTCRAFAKINLDLRVLGVRPDGYHELRTTFQSIALADSLTFTSTPGPFRIDCNDPDCPTDRRNLIWRTAELVWRMARRRGSPRDLHVKIVKRIPMQAGLGGGSSNAAVALRALATIWRVALTKERRYGMAAALGADVPYFFEGGTVLGVGRGDRLLPLEDLPRAWTVIIVPGFGVSTKEAFSWWDDDWREGQEGRDRQDRRERREGADKLRLASNDLQAAVAKRHPIVLRLVAALKREGASHASLSGSGSAVFGLFERRSDAERAAGALTGRTRRAFLTKTLTRRECRRLAAK
jgi:4-diphosphocytidyl-2-C-methyl-D-erythritol kinase